jgi:hypothetical protein
MNFNLFFFCDKISKKDKRVKQKEIPRGKIIAQGGNPEKFLFIKSSMDVCKFR